MNKTSLPLLLLLLPTALSCGVAADAKNASCCSCAGYDGSGAACHWCPPVEPNSLGSCRYRGSANYSCVGFVSKRAACPGAPCPPVGPSGSPAPAGGSPSATPSNSPSPAPLPSPVPLRPFSKKGVGYFGGNCSDFGAAGLSNITWFYDWGHDQASMDRAGCPSRQRDHSVDGVEYIPMIWGKYALKNISDMNTTFFIGARTIFSFNEPDHTGSSFLPPAEAAERWPNMVALARAFNLTLVAPCVSNYASGQWWLAAFNEGCKNLTGKSCAYDHMCLHTYFNVSHVSDLFSSLERMHADYGLPIWLNEFACPPYKHCSAADQLKFAQLVVPRLESLPYLYRYAWFEARSQGNETLLVWDNATSVQRTPLGDFYNSV